MESAAVVLSVKSSRLAAWCQTFPIDDWRFEEALVFSCRLPLIRIPLLSLPTDILQSAIL